MKCVMLYRIVYSRTRIALPQLTGVLTKAGNGAAAWLTRFENSDPASNQFSPAQ